MNTVLTRTGEYNDPKTGEKGTVKVSYDPINGRTQVIITKSTPSYIPPQKINRVLEELVMEGLSDLKITLTEDQIKQILNESRKK